MESHRAHTVRPLPGAHLRGRTLVVLALLAASAALAGAATATTRMETLGEPGESLAGAPAWTQPCRSNEPRPDRQLLARCARATGIVAHVRARGTGPSREVHFALLGRFGALIVKLGDPHSPATPHVGERVTVVGPLVRASNGMREIQAWSLR